MSDEEVAEILKLARKARVTIHVRGTDRNPVVEVREKATFGRRGAVVGGIELKGRLANG